MNNIVKANNVYSKKRFTLFLCEDREAPEVSYNNSTYNIGVIKRRKRFILTFNTIFLKLL